jgi:hypothetical protein
MKNAVSGWDGALRRHRPLPADGTNVSSARKEELIGAPLTTQRVVSTLRRQVWLLSIVASLAGSHVFPAYAADVLYYFVAKGKEFNQFSSALPVPKGNPARFVSFVGLTATNSATNATVQSLLSGTVKALTLGVGGKAGVDDTFSFQAKFTSQSLLDSAAPNGNYQITIQTVHDGTKTPVLALTGDSYPSSAPYITNPFDTNFNVILVTNSAAAFTLTWAPFTGGGASDFIQVTLSDIQGNPVLQTPDPGQAGALHGLATSLVVPANKLPSASLIGGSLVFAKTVALNSTAYPGVPGFASYYSASTFPLVTFAEDVQFYNVTKNQVFKQNSSGTPTLANSPFRFVAQVIATASNSVNSAQVQLPAAGGIDALPPDPNGTVFAFQQNFGTQAALDAAFASGVYTFQINAVHDGNRSLPLNLPADSFPVTPHVANWAAAQNVNPQAGFKLTWDPFTGATSADDIHIFTTDNLGNTVTEDFLSTSNTSITFPAGTFQSGQTYGAQIQFRHFVTVDTTNYPGTTGSSRFISRTIFNLTTAGVATAPLLSVLNTNSPGAFQIMLTGQAGALYAIDGSTNLQKGSWIPLITNTAVSGQLIYTDAQSTSFPSRFYRGRAAN